MTTSAVTLTGIGKRYQVATSKYRYARLTENLSSALLHPRRRSRTEPFWALRDVSFEVAPGEVVGFVGRNGAGKSTLLKILSRITEPTTGQAVLRGRVGSLLEVGTGFHPELTGRENIYLSGSILGMRRAEIRARFDEIVAFAEVDSFLDVPVKRYSSGMQVRLGFAVAAHLEPEILIVDEVLAVGDASFQKKSLARMENVAHAGRTVLFVSHNMAAVESLCTRAVLLQQGQVAAVGTPGEVIATYLGSIEPAVGVLADRTDRQGDGRVRLRSLTADVRTGSPSAIRIAYEAPVPVQNAAIAVGLFSLRGEGAAHLSTEISGANLGTLPRRGIVTCELDRVQLLPGTYTVNVYCTVNGAVADWVQDAGTIVVEDGDYFGTGKLPPGGYGFTALPQRWTVEDVG